MPGAYVTRHPFTLMATVSSHTPLTDPVLVSPQREAPVTGRDVLLSWEPVPGAEAYLVQVARDTAFEDLAVEESAGSETSLRIEDVLPENRATFYWRVIAQGEGGESPGEHVESFIVMTPDQVESAPATEPDTDEPTGPVSKLFQAAGAEMTAEVSGSDAADAAVDALGVEPEGVESAQIIGLTLSVLAALALIIFLLFNWNATVLEQTMVQAVNMSGYPDLVETEAAAARQLSQYEVLSDADGVYRVPIDRVITLMANEAQTRRDTAYSAELPVLTNR